MGAVFIGLFRLARGAMTYHVLAYQRHVDRRARRAAVDSADSDSGGLVILSIAMVDELVHVLAGNKPRYEREPPRTAEEVVERAPASGV